MTPECAFCHNTIELDEKYHSPVNAVKFRSWGEYGSTVFGRFDGSILEIHVCDGCLVARCDDVVYYGPQTVRRPGPWDPEITKGEIDV